MLFSDSMQNPANEKPRANAFFLTFPDVSTPKNTSASLQKAMRIPMHQQRQEHRATFVPYRWSAGGWWTVGCKKNECLTTSLLLVLLLLQLACQGFGLAAFTHIRFLFIVVIHTLARFEANRKHTEMHFHPLCDCSKLLLAGHLPTHLPTHCLLMVGFRIGKTSNSSGAAGWWFLCVHSYKRKASWNGLRCAAVC